MQASRSTAQRGFTIIEVMMAATILLVGFIGLMQAVTIGSESLDTARKLQIASQLATAEIEKLRGGNWDTVASLQDFGTISISPAGLITGDLTQFSLTNHSDRADDDNTDLTLLAKGFTCSFTREYLRPSVSAGQNTATFLRVTYTITWKTNTGRSQHHQATAYFGKNGLHLSYQQS